MDADNTLTDAEKWIPVFFVSTAFVLALRWRYEEAVTTVSFWYFLIAFLAILALQSVLFAPHAEN